MYPVAHIVAASGACWGAERMAWRLFGGKDMTRTGPDPNRPSLFDFRLVAVGSWLPDAIDKPLAWFILRNVVEDDHLLGHTLFFGVVLAVPGVYLAWRGERALLGIASGVLMHRLCDPIWPEISTVIWPLNGWAFEHSTTPYFGIYMLLELLSAAVLFVVIRRLWRRDQMCSLISRGEI